MKNKPKRIYISSTYSDLKDYRDVVYRNLRGLRYDVISMEDYSASSRLPVEKCLEDVASCDVYIGIIAWRYGYIPKEYQESKTSITELEYRKALQKGIPTLIFLLDKSVPWSPDFMDSHTKEGENGTLIEKFRKELMEKYIVSFFTSEVDLANKIMQALYILDESTEQDLIDSTSNEQSDAKLILEDDLHDLVNMYYFGVVSHLEALNEWSKREDFQKIKQHIPNVITNSRTVLNELKSMRNVIFKDVFETDNMKLALQKMTKDFGFSLGLQKNPISIKCPADMNMPVVLKNSLLRITSSALLKTTSLSDNSNYSNVKISIKLSMKDNVVRLTIKNNVNSGDEKETDYYNNRMKNIIFQLNHQKIKSDIKIVPSTKGLTISVKSVL